MFFNLVWDGRAVEKSKTKDLKQIQILLQSLFFIVCLNQGHFFSKFFSISFLEFFLSQNIMGREAGSGGRVIQKHECPKESLKLSLPGSYQNLISILESNPVNFGQSLATR
jgi:hypothetical protein